MSEERQTSHGSLVRELQRCRERIRELTLCAEVSRLISSSLELDEVLDRIMTTSRSVMRADACSLMLLDEETQDLVFHVAQSAVGDQLKQGFRLKKGQGIAGCACESGEAILIEDAYLDPRFHRDFDVRTGYRTRSILCVPLKVKERIIGVSQVINKLDGTPFNHEDLETFTDLCMHAAIAIENARIHRALLQKQQMESDLAFATNVQQSFLPRDVPTVDGYRFCAHYQSALQVGGDFYDFIPLSGRRLGILIGDVSGKGVSSALYMARLMSDFRIHALQRKGPAQVMTDINDLLCERSQRGMFVTLLYLILNPATRTVHMVNGGHLPPLVWNRREGRLHTHRAMGAPPLGILPGRSYRTHRLRLQPGDCLLLATDGLVEARNSVGEPFGWQALHDAVQKGDSKPEHVLDRVMKTLRVFVGRSPRSDDITMVVLGVDETR
jgi:sigma-B regulation protein RsbU (phosphoserine phosphatase)